MNARTGKPKNRISRRSARRSVCVQKRPCWGTAKVCLFRGRVCRCARHRWDGVRSGPDWEMSCMMISEQIQAANQVQSANWRRCLRIGDLTLGFTAHGMDVHLDPDHQSFVVPSQNCEIEIDLEWVDSLLPADGKKLFDSGAVWTLYEGADHYV